MGTPKAARACTVRARSANHSVMRSKILFALTVLIFGVAACGESVDKTSKAAESDTKSEVVKESDSPTSTSSKAAHKALEIVSKGFAYVSGEADKFGYGVVIRNPNDDEAATSVSVNVTFFDAAGGVVSSESEELSVILPGATNAVGDGVSETPGATRMEVQVLPGDWETLSDTGSFSVEGVRTVPQQYLGVKTTALVKSTFAKDLESMKATAIYYAADGAITAGTFTYVDFVPANGSVGIELSTFSRPAAFDRTDVFIEITSLTMLEAED